VLGIPFDFTAKPVVAPPTRPRKTVRVEAVRPDRDALEIRFPRVEGYRVELPEERLTAMFTADSVLELSPALVGPSITKNQGIIGEGIELTLAHLNDMRPSTILYHLAARLLFTKFRDPGDDPKMYLFNQLKRIAREWLDGGYLRCTGGTHPAQLIYQDLADRACERIKAAITEAMVGEHPIKAVLDPYNPAGSTAHVRFDTSKDRSCRTGIVGADATRSKKPAVGSAPAHFAGSLILDPAGHYSTCDFPRAHPADRIVNPARPAKFTTKSTGGNMTRPRAADDFPAIRARIDELRRERLTRVRAADDFPAIRARMEELRRERVQASARPATQPLPPLPDHTAQAGSATPVGIVCCEPSGKKSTNMTGPCLRRKHHFGAVVLPRDNVERF
jgi:hypothetical protein